MPLKDPPLVDFLLVGGGLASATAAETLRGGGAEGSIAILSAEATLPYHRPPLSKDLLLKGPENANILIYEEAHYREHDIAVHLGTRVARVDCASRTLATEQGTEFGFAKLLIATGASVDRLAVHQDRDRLAHVPAKWVPVRRQEHAPTKELQPFPLEGQA